MEYSKFITIFAAHLKQQPLKHLIMKATHFWVEYNGAFIACYKSVRACLNFIARKDLRNDDDNIVRIMDNNGDCYDVISGNKIDYEL